MIKNNQMFRALLILGAMLVTTFVLLMGTVVLRIPGFSSLAFAHAANAVAQTTCAADPTEPHCTNQDPVQQGCSQDAQTLAYEGIFNPQGKQLATIERRYSATCHSEWGRITEPPDKKEPLTILIGKFPLQATPGPVAFSNMVFVPNLSVASVITGTISINGISSDQDNGQALGGSLPALPAAQS
jgi:hypothetical protein